MVGIGTFMHVRTQSYDIHIPGVAALSPRRTEAEP